MKEVDEIVDGEVTVRATVCLTSARIGVAEDLLARVRGVSTASAVDITANITISVPDVVLVSGVELVVCEALEGLALENDTFLKRQSNTLQEQRILKSTKMLQMVVLAQ